MIVLTSWLQNLFSKDSPQQAQNINYRLLIALLYCSASQPLFREPHADPKYLCVTLSSLPIKPLTFCATYIVLQ